jgi:hypothetical protein
LKDPFPDAAVPARILKAIAQDEAQPRSLLSRAFNGCLAEDLKLFTLQSSNSVSEASKQVARNEIVIDDVDDEV